VFTARYALSPYIKQIRFVFKGLNYWSTLEALCLTVSLLWANKAATGDIQWHVHPSYFIVRNWVVTWWWAPSSPFDSWSLLNGNREEDTDGSHFVGLQSNISSFLLLFLYGEEEQLFECLVQAELGSNMGLRGERPATNPPGPCPPPPP
jgi:hypothetical protein